jgi:hypothetical protein
MKDNPFKMSSEMESLFNEAEKLIEMEARIKYPNNWESRKYGMYIVFTTNGEMRVEG